MEEDREEEDVDFRAIYGKTVTKKIPEVLTTKTSPDPKQNVRNNVSNNVTVSDSPRVIFSPSVYSPKTQTPSSINYRARDKSGDILVHYNCKSSSDWEVNQPRAVGEVVLFPSTDRMLKKQFRYMFQKTRDVALAMDNLIDRIGNTILSECEVEEHQSLKDSSTEDSVYIGRIRSDGKLTTENVFFEGTLDTSQGHVVMLDLALEEYFLFPGQVVALVGKNNLGKYVKVSQVNIPRPLPFSSEVIDLKSGPLSVLIAAGPFTPTDSLQYDPLTDLIDVIKTTQPNVCILIGPFIDSSHPLIDTMAETFEDEFIRCMESLSKSLATTETHLVLVPSFKDAHHHNVFPTPPYHLGKSLKKFTVVPDPAMVSIEGIVFGITSTDVLMHLGKNELAKSTISAERMGRLSRHILSQQNFYPLYPPDESVPVDIEHLTDYGQMDCTPHILVLPSGLRHFIKDVDGTVVVNPQHLTKGPSGGTYAQLQIEVPNNSSVGSISDFVLGKIVKI